MAFTHKLRKNYAFKHSQISQYRDTFRDDRKTNAIFITNIAQKRDQLYHAEITHDLHGVKKYKKYSPLFSPDRFSHSANARVSTNRESQFPTPWQRFSTDKRFRTRVIPVYVIPCDANNPPRHRRHVCTSAGVVGSTRSNSTLSSRRARRSLSSRLFLRFRLSISVHREYRPTGAPSPFLAS